MGYATWREHPGDPRAGAPAPVRRRGGAAFHVLDVTVACAEAAAVRRALAGCDGVGVVRCEPLLFAANAEDAAPRARLMVRLPLAAYAEVLHRLLACVPHGEIGRLLCWRDHLARRGLAHGDGDGDGA